ncbi:hypothetical protein BC938DRAFT_483445 [Jimgerdemannia flammicorona]|uniref:RRM domain-containing protein n=1 Tax=Jimgerdemannia flammicorona TaxID=994334 RepID=A0A433QC39_9FUNG|nr:hypothetical protein BC938DRAFT_483445 [Jimgerdemannia flammicorona]
MSQEANPDNLNHVDIAPTPAAAAHDKTRDETGLEKDMGCLRLDKGRGQIQRDTLKNILHSDETPPTATELMTHSVPVPHLMAKAEETERMESEEAAIGGMEMYEFERDVREVSADRRGSPAGCLFVASLAASKTDEQLQVSVTKHFHQWGPLLNVKVMKDWMHRPYAFVQFENVTDAKHALTEAHNSLVDGRHIRVEQARVNRTLFIGKFGRNLNEDDIRDMLSRYGSIEDITILQNYHTGKSKGCGFVKFCYRDDAIKAFLSLRSPHAHLKWGVEWASNLEFRGGPIGSPIDKQSVFIGQLNPQEITQELLEERFGVYGKIESAHLVNRGGSNTAVARDAFAFIKYTEEEAAANAIEHENNSNYLDRTIKVAYRKSNENLVRPNRYGTNYSTQFLSGQHAPHPPGVGYPAAAAQLAQAQAQGFFSPPGATILSTPVPAKGHAAATIASRTPSATTAPASVNIQLPLKIPAQGGVQQNAQQHQGAFQNVTFGSLGRSGRVPAGGGHGPGEGKAAHRGSAGVVSGVSGGMTTGLLMDPAIIAAGTMTSLVMNPDPSGVYTGGLGAQMSTSETPTSTYGITPTPVYHPMPEAYMYPPYTYPGTPPTPGGNRFPYGIYGEPTYYEPYMSSPTCGFVYGYPGTMYVPPGGAALPNDTPGVYGYPHPSYMQTPTSNPGSHGYGFPPQRRQPDIEIRQPPAPRRRSSPSSVSSIASPVSPSPTSQIVQQHPQTQELQQVFRPQSAGPPYVIPPQNRVSCRATGGGTSNAAAKKLSHVVVVGGSGTLPGGEQTEEGDLNGAEYDEYEEEEEEEEDADSVDWVVNEEEKK